MRILLVMGSMVLLALAGCTAPEEADMPDPAWGVCPQWIHGGQTWVETVEVDGSNRTTLDGNVTQMDGRPLDLYVVEATSDAPIVLRFFAGERQLQVHGDGAFQPSLRLDGDAEVQLFLSPADHGSTPAPSPLTMELEGNGVVDLRVQPWFRVCGT
ncbi:MAG: hypothetical protein ACPHID_00620 [Thermoplasmatota archaeon]